MAWDFVPELTSICVLLTILVFHRKYSYNSNLRDRRFVNCISASVAYSSLRTAFVLALSFPNSVSQSAIYLLRDCSMLALMFMPLTLMEYALQLVYEKNPRPYYKAARLWAYLQVFIIAVLLVLNRRYPILYHLDNSSLSFGRYALLPALIVLCSMAVYLVAVLLEIKNLQSQIRNALLAAPLTALPFIVLQQFMPRLQLYGTAFMLNILVLYLAIHSNIKNYDKSTGCFTRKAFNLELKRTYSKAARVSFLMVMLSNHAVIFREYGDQLLKAIMRELALCLKQTFGQLNVYLTGESTFVCAMPGQIRTWDIEKLLSMLNSELLVNGLLIKLESSMALYETLDGRELSDELLNCLEFALKKAKKTPERIVACDESVINEYALEKQIAKRLKEAIDSNDYLLCFNPICSLSCNPPKIIAADCLISFETSEGGAYSYEQIKPIAERNNLLNPLNELIFRRACSLAAKLRANGQNELKLFCKITHNQLRSTSIAARLTKIANEEGAPESSIVLELSGQAVSVEPHMSENLAALKCAGIDTCLSDMSKSSVEDALTAPFSYIKFNEADIFKNGLNARLNAFFKLMPAFFARFNTTVIAQNVVSSEHARFLFERGIKYAQGPGILTPLTEAELIAKLNLTPETQLKLELIKH